MSVVALVPMRHDSERVPGKNYRPFNGRPLFVHIVSTLLSVPSIDEVVIDTDSPVITAQAAETFQQRVRVLERPFHLRAGDTPMNEVLLHSVTSCPADVYLQTHSTNPLLQPDTVERAIQTYLAGSADSLFSATRLATRLWWDEKRPVNHDPAVLLRTQDLPPIYEENSNIYIFTAASLRATGNRIGRTPMLFEIDRTEAWDIDEEHDFIVAELLHKQREMT